MPVAVIIRSEAADKVENNLPGLPRHGAAKAQKRGLQRSSQTQDFPSVRGHGAGT